LKISIILFLSFFTAYSQTQPMSSCNLVVYKVGNGATSLSGSAFPVSIDEINPINGNISQTLTTQFTGSSLLTQSGSAPRPNDER
jgi:hypothetical protein